MDARRIRMLGIGMGLFLVGGLGGIVLDRMQFERERAALLARYEAGIRGWEAAAMTTGPGAPAAGGLAERGRVAR